MTNAFRTETLMINRLCALLAVTLGALVIGLASTAGVGELPAHLIDDPGTGTTAGGRIDHQCQALAMRTGGRIDI